MEVLEISLTKECLAGPATVVEDFQANSAESPARYQAEISDSVSGRFIKSLGGSLSAGRIEFLLVSSDRVRQELLRDSFLPVANGK